MPYAVELALDAEASAVVRRAWHDLAAAGFIYMARSGARPHVSLAIWDEIDPGALTPRLEAFAAEHACDALTFDRVDSFTGGVVYLAAAPSAALRGIHAAFHIRFGDIAASVWPHYRPEAWIPHCTLAMDLDSSAVAPALAIAERIPLPLTAHLERLGLVEFQPVRELARFPLAAP